MFGHWAALLPGTDAGAHDQGYAQWQAGVRADAAHEAGFSARADRQSLCLWALQLGPRVVQLEEAVLMELAASARLFGGWARLCTRVRREAQAMGAHVAWARTAHAALALARCAQSGSWSAPLLDQLDPLPLSALTAVAQQQATLARLGCRTLGDVRRLPRAGLARRVGAAALLALDQAHGLQAAVHTWCALPEQFEARLELPSRVESALVLQFGAQRLLRLLASWLAARHLGVLAFSLHWQHDCVRSGVASGQVCVRTGQPTQQVDHLLRLLREHLAHVRLPAPAEWLSLTADEVAPWDGESLALLPDGRQRSQSVAQALERIQARLGSDSVRQPVLHDDHRLEWMQHWQWLGQTGPGAATVGRADAGARVKPRAPAPRNGRGSRDSMDSKELNPSPESSSGRNAEPASISPAWRAERRTDPADAGTSATSHAEGTRNEGQAWRWLSQGLSSASQAAPATQDEHAAAPDDASGPGAFTRLRNARRLTHEQALSARNAPSLPVPSWLLPEPVRLAVIQHRPQWGGPLQLLLGPERVEGGWWHHVPAPDVLRAMPGQAGSAHAPRHSDDVTRTRIAPDHAATAQDMGASSPAAAGARRSQVGQVGSTASAPPVAEGGRGQNLHAVAPMQHLNVQRDYWLAQSPQAGLLCVFQQRLAGDEIGWFLHGHYG